MCYSLSYHYFIFFSLLQGCLSLNEPSGLEMLTIDIELFVCKCCACTENNKQVTHVRPVLPHSAPRTGESVTKGKQSTKRKSIMNYENINKGKQELTYLSERVAQSYQRF